MPIGDCGRSWKMLYFDPRLIAEAVGDISEGGTNTFEFAFPVMNGRHIARRFLKLYAAMTTPGEPIDREESLLMLLATVRSLPESTLCSSIPTAVVRARVLIDDDPARSLTLSDLAQESGLSRFKVLRSFARATGLTPHAYIVQRRINLARRLIRGRMPLAEAAMAAGFADQSHMTRIFRRTFGISPGAYADAMP
jgi:AraC-like DNA-binding protein